MNEAQKAKEAAIDQVRDNRPDDYSQVLVFLNELIRDKGKYSTFTSEDLIEKMGDRYLTLHEPRVLGAAFRTVRLSGRIRAAGYVHGKRRERHAAPVMAWTVMKVEP